MELSALSYIVENSTNRSLILIDEFGKGTHYLDGLSLFHGVWKSFQNKITDNNTKDENSSAPLLLMASTHSELFEQGIIKSNREMNGIKSVIFEMQSKLNTTAETNSTDYVHLYTVKEYETSETKQNGINKSKILEFEKFHEHRSVLLEDKTRDQYINQLKGVRELAQNLDNLNIDGWLNMN